MESFRRQFALEAVENLEKISADLRRAEKFSEAERREIFRTLHTIKGTAQTFGFAESSRLAHALETMLAENFSQEFFLEGVALLIESLNKTDFQIPQTFAEKIRAASVQETAYDENDFSDEVPPEIFLQLTQQEKKRLHAAIGAGENLYCLEINFGAAAFADGLINFRAALNAAGEIIATFPGTKFGADGQIGFRVLLASAREISEIETHGARLTFQFSPDDLLKDFRAAAEQVVRHGAAIAKKFGKQIQFEITADEAELSAEKIKLLFSAMLHLVRNAVDHAIEKRGKIKISLRAEADGLRLEISDDGRGIDLKKARALAIEKNLIAEDDNLTERATIDLVFLPEFSTKRGATEISGRGIGLDAARSAIETANGKIEVKTETGKGTSFEIFLPR